MAVDALALDGLLVDLVIALDMLLSWTRQISDASRATAAHTFRNLPIPVQSDSGECSIVEKTIL